MPDETSQPPLPPPRPRPPPPPPLDAPGGPEDRGGSREQCADGGFDIFSWSARIALLAAIVYCWLECPKMGKNTAAVSLPDAASWLWTGVATGGGGGGGGGSSGGVRVFTAEELDAKKGEEGGDIYLAIFGDVFDVTSGRQYYGKDGGYGFFAGRDCSKAFVTGEFDAKGLTDDVSELSEQQMLEVDRWQRFYHDHETYTFKGLLAGQFYDANGRPTDAHRDAVAKVARAKQSKVKDDAKQQKYPNCNMKWAQNVGGELWCEDSALVPRKMKHGETKRCGCIDPAEAASAPKELGLEQYDGCDAKAHKCTTPP